MCIVAIIMKRNYGILDKNIEPLQGCPQASEIVNCTSLEEKLLPRFHNKFGMKKII